MKEKETLGPCCRLGICCPPDRAAEALAAHEGIEVDAASKILAGYQLVPLSIETGPEHVTKESIRSARQRLERLHRRNSTELAGILTDMGHAAQENT